jgi:hypothetical protein
MGPGLFRLRAPGKVRLCSSLGGWLAGFVESLKDTCTAQEAIDARRCLGTIEEPVHGALIVDLEYGISAFSVLLGGIIPAKNLDEAAVTGTTGVGYDNTIEGAILATHALQTNANHDFVR